MKLGIKRSLDKWFSGQENIVPASFKRWHIVLAGLYTVQALAILLFSVPHNEPITVSYLTRDTLQSRLTHHTVLAPAVHQLSTLNIAWLIAVSLLLIALMHLLFATYYRTQYEATLKRRVQPMRWLVYGILFVCMLTTVGLLAGDSNVPTILITCTLALATACMAFISEVASTQQTKGEISLRTPVQIAGVTMTAAPIAALLIFAAAANLFGSSTTPTYIYGLLAVIVVWVGAIITNIYLLYMKRGVWSSYVYGERLYMLLTVACLSVFAWGTFLAVLRP